MAAERGRKGRAADCVRLVRALEMSAWRERIGFDIVTFNGAHPAFRERMQGRNEAARRRG